MATVIPLRREGQEPAVRSLIRVIETDDGRMVVTASEGMDKQTIIGNLVLAAVHYAQTEGG